MINRKQIASGAIVKALQARKKLMLNFDESVSALDAAERLGIEVRITDLPSMEGMYVAGTRPKIILSRLRSPGRMNFTCAHEIGHHMHGHGEQFDELIVEKSPARKISPEELQADCFAAFFLMPKVTIDHAMSTRGYRYDTLSPIQAFTLCSWLGVSYSGFVNHLAFGLKVISQRLAQLLIKTTPIDFRKQVFEPSASTNLVVADEFWKGRAIDCAVGDYILFPQFTEIEGELKLKIERTNSRVIARAEAPGIARASNKAWSSFIRISPRKYIGRGCYRFEEEVEE